MVDPSPHQLAERGIAEVVLRCPVGYGGIWHIAVLTICKVTVYLILVNLP
jgi:hypothetical protein